MTATSPAALSGWRAFLRWLTSPSWTTLAIAFGIVALYLLVGVGPRDGLYRMQKLATGGEVYGNESLFLYNQVSLLKQTIGRGEAKPIIAYVGGSTTRESIYSEVAFEGEIRSRTGLDVRAFELTSSGQTMMTSWNLVELAACSGADLVVLGLNQNRTRNVGTNHPSDDVGYLGDDVADYIAAGRYQPRLASLQSQLTAFIRFQTGKLWTFWHAISTGAQTFDAVGYRVSGRHRYLESRLAPHSIRDKQAQFDQFEQDASTPVSGELMSRIVRTARDCGSRVIVFFSPVSIVDAERYPQLAAGQAQLLLAGSEAGLGPDEMLELQPLGWSADDFHDWGHFSRLSAIHRATSAIAAFVAEHLRESRE